MHGQRIYISACSDSANEYARNAKAGTEFMIFSWLKNRQLREFEKLLFQNCNAASSGAYAFLSGRDTQATARLIHIETRTREIAKQPFSSKNASELLDLNKEYRKIYGVLSAIPGFRTFDESNRPTLGWKEFYAGRGL